MKTGLDKESVAMEIGVHASAISRELARNGGEKGYRFHQARRMADECRSSAAKCRKIAEEMIAMVESKVREDLSPDQVSGWHARATSPLASSESVSICPKIKKSGSCRRICVVI